MQNMHAILHMFGHFGNFGKTFHAQVGNDDASFFLWSLVAEHTRSVGRLRKLDQEISSLLDLAV